MAKQSTHPGSDPRHVSLVALPDAVVSTLSGIFDVMNAFALMGLSNAGSGARAPFHIEIGGEAVGPSSRQAATHVAPARCRVHGGHHQKDKPDLRMHLTGSSGPCPLPPAGDCGAMARRFAPSGRVGGFDGESG